MNSETTTCRACLKQGKKIYGIFKEIYMGLSLADIFCKIINPTELAIMEENSASSYFCDLCKTLLLKFYKWECKFKENQHFLLKIKKEISDKHGEIANIVNKENKNQWSSESTSALKDEFLKDTNNVYVSNLELGLNQCERNTEITKDNDHKAPNNMYDCQNERDIMKKRPPRKFRCGICPDYFNEHKLLNHPIKEHHPSLRDLPLKSPGRPPNRHCKLCDVAFQDLPSYQKHVRTHRPYLCEQCGKSFGKKNHLVDHKEFHLTFKQYICNDCGKNFRTRSSFKTHRKIHSQPRSYVCEICGRGFNSNSAMKSHVSIIHLKERKFACFMCSQSFSLKATLSKHVRSHDKERERTFMCKECPMAYWESSHLRQHLLMKHSERCRKFCCDYCEKEYTTNSNLKKHINEKHSHGRNELLTVIEVESAKFK